MNPYIGGIIGSIVRSLLLYLAGRYSLEFSDTQVAEATGALLALSMLGWSQYNLHRSRQKIVTLAAQAQTTEKEVEQTIHLVGAPSVMTPKTEVPVTP